MSAACYIYGLYDRRERCRYVGLTRDPKQRAYAHRKYKLTFIVLIETDEDEGPKLERDLIRAFELQGQCQMNRMHRRSCRRKYPKKIQSSPDLSPVEEPFF